MRLIVLLLLLLSLCACNKNDFPQYIQLGPLRVLTLASTGNPEVNPGATVVLQPVISDLNGGGRTLSVNVQTCVDPGIGLGNLAICANPDTNTNSSFSSTTLGSNNVYTGLAPTVTVNVPNLTLATSLQKYNGINYLVIYTISAPDGQTVQAFKRIVVTDPTKPSPNQNPVFSGVTANGTALAASNAYSSVLQNITPAFSVGAENYQVMLPDGSFEFFAENLTTTWFISDGSMEFERTFAADTNQWTPGKPSTRDAVLVLVAHDGRGGEGYQIFQFH